MATRLVGCNRLLNILIEYSTWTELACCMVHLASYRLCSMSIQTLRLASRTAQPTLCYNWTSNLLFYWVNKYVLSPTVFLQGSANKDQLRLLRIARKDWRHDLEETSVYEVDNFQFDRSQRLWNATNSIDSDRPWPRCRSAVHVNIVMSGMNIPI